MSPVARAFGLKAEHVETPDQLEEGLERAFSSKHPYFLDVVTEAGDGSAPAGIFLVQGCRTGTQPAEAKIKKANQSARPAEHAGTGFPRRYS